MGFSIARKTLVELSRHSGVEPADFADVMRAYGLRAELVPAARSVRPPFSGDEIARHFRAHRARYVQPPQWYVDAAVIPRRGQARRMLRGFQRTPTSAQLVERFEGQGAIRPSDANLMNAELTRPEVLRMARALDVNEGGMVKDPRGWYVFIVRAKAPAIQPTFETARNQVEQELTTKRIRELFEAYNERLRLRDRDDTVCADGYDVPECGDRPLGAKADVRRHP